MLRKFQTRISKPLVLSVFSKCSEEKMYRMYKRSRFAIPLLAILTTAHSLDAVFSDVTSWLPTSLVARQSEQSSEEYRLRPRATIELSLVRGSVKVETWNKPFAVVNIVKHGRSAEELAETSLVVDATPAKLLLNSNQPHAQSLIDISLVVPADTSVSVSVNEQGSITIVSAPRTLKLHTQHGEITGTTYTDGAIQANTEQGSIIITCEAFSPTSSLLCTAPQGTITLYLPPMVQARLEAKSQRASVLSQLPITFDAFTTKLEKNTWKQLQKKVKGLLGEGDAPITLTARGTIFIKRYEP